MLINLYRSLRLTYSYYITEMLNILSGNNGKSYAALYYCSVFIELFSVTNHNHNINLMLFLLSYYEHISILLFYVIISLSNFYFWNKSRCFLKQTLFIPDEVIIIRNIEFVILSFKIMTHSIKLFNSKSFNGVWIFNYVFHKENWMKIK